MSHAWRIEGPAPVPPRYTLIGASRVVTDVDEGVERWAGGARVYPFPADEAHVWDACALGTETKVEGEAVTSPDFGAMTVYLAITCSTLGISGGGLTPREVQDRFVARAKAVFGAVEAAAVEREFMAGEVLLNPHLADGEGVFPWGDGSTCVPNAFALLEDAIAATGRQGLIHCSPAVASAGSRDHLLFPDDRASAPVLRTVNGTVVVPGYGYAAGATPAGGAHPDAGATEAWVYATGPVEVRRSEVMVNPETYAQALDRGENVVTFRAERTYLVTWDAVFQAAVLADRCTTDCGEAPA